ncbi:phage tail sheath subtilisin-like domain-containing protein [Providencia huaxiensis]|uniref:Phage tail sheath subtilisin-like domain-containing protein n=2 Tax=Providencia huaxiensis TaxID=2027290 RepID=A0ABU2J0M9_9GAMM|nr:phage tail sheath C-terminal domain-containing protein [Providencia huaxiensis]MDI7238738.1 phage tail sheath C-terminal domain-containing protein [Providencia huaxiensis]MDT0134877.1 phage tail sheath subtilisin-like domain-containing protein [Providencia huaxiensis]MDT1981282.1 phage tail sheath subtilisin-like domain-containing protein [Providencia huaxiensis]
MMTVTFDTIPGSIRKPGKYLEFNTRMATRTLPGNPQTLLIIAPMLSSAQVAPLTPIDIYDDSVAGTAFGEGSLAHLMAKSAISANNYLQLQVIGIEEAVAGKKATATVTITAPATRGGTLSLSVCGERLDIPVETADTAESLNQAVLEAVNARGDLPVIASLEGEESTVLTLTAKQSGAWGNDIALDVQSTAKGVTATVTAMQGGENNADIQPALDAVFAAGHDIIAQPFSDKDSLLKLRTHLEKVSGALEQRGAIGAVGWTGTLSTGTTLASDINDGRTSIAWYPGSMKLPCQIAAAYGAVIAFEEDPARPLNTLELKGLDIAPVTKRAGRNEQENALHNGLTPLEVGAGNRVQIVRAVTTYTRNVEGVEDTALLDLTTIRTLDYTRKACRERLSQRFPREKLNERTRAKVRSELLDVLIKLEEEEILENVEENKGMLLVERDGKDPNRLNAAIPADVVNGLHVFAGRIDLLV